MTAQVTARSRRTLEFGMFAAMLPDAQVLTFAQAAGRQVTVTFDRELTPAEVETVTACLSSTDDDDAADRAEMADLMTAVEAMGPEPVRDLLLHLTTRVLDA